MAWRRLARGFGAAAVAVSVAGASWPALSHRLPRHFFVALGVAGGALALVWLVSALHRPRASRSWSSLGLSALAVVGLVVLPGVRFVGALRAVPPGSTRVLAGFGDWIGAEGYPKLVPHTGVDVAARPGTDVLAAADGRVVLARDRADLCGNIIVIVHEPHDYRTVYCHSAALFVGPGDVVRRGQRIAASGTTGQRPWPGYEHVHLELQRGTDKNALEDPLARMAGCFDATARYPTDRLVLTYPVPCPPARAGSER